MAERRGEPHPYIPGLYRKLSPPGTGELMYPYLPSERTEHQRYQPPTPQPLGKGLLPDDSRGGVSPLGGEAVKEQSK
jgi:hypothetical protein